MALACLTGIPLADIRRWTLDELETALDWVARRDGG